MIFSGLIEDLIFSTEVFCPHGTQMIIPREAGGGRGDPPNVFLLNIKNKTGDF